jgi:hypothetical protein
MKKDSTSTAKVGFSVVLGVIAVFVMFLAGAVTEVPGKNSIREIVTSCLVGAGLASKKWTPIQAALMSFSCCMFSKATGER